MRDDTIEAACVVALALAWATITVVRLLLVPAVALLLMLLMLLTPRRRPAPQPAPALPAVTLATIAAGLEALPAAELRSLAGTRRRCSKRELAGLICAMPI